MTWTSALRSLLIRLLQLGPIPRHVAFIMDGNRRFAQVKGVVVAKGHEEGFSKLEETLDWCLSLGVTTVTTYAFSIENFNRKPDEVNKLMNLAKNKFEEFATKSDIIEKHGIAVKVFGNLALLPPEVQLAASRAVLMTRHNKRAVLNVCIPYTSRDEMALAMRDIVRGVERGMLCPDDITEGLLEAALQTGESPPLDILVRTSGEVRLSDFMLWQASKGCHIHYINALWPEFTFWDMLPALLSFQAYHTDLLRARGEKIDAPYKDDQQFILRQENFLKTLRREREENAVRLALESRF